MKYNNSPLVSVIMPCYNSVDFIKESIEAIINQVYTVWELIIVDDKSNDRTCELINKYLLIDKRIKLIKLEVNSGAATARNMGLKEAKGRFISFCDSDDVWSQNKLVSQVHFMLDRKAPISFTSYGVYDCRLLNEYYVVNVPKAINYHGYLKNTIIGMSTSMIDKASVGEFSFYNIRTRQDTYLWMTLLKKGHIAYGIKEKLVKYRIRETSISSNKYLAAKRVWYLYYNLEKLGFLKSVYYFVHYAYNTVKKRRLL